MNRKEIETIIPNREPYLFLDEVIIEEENKKGKGIKQLSGDEYFFEGHFPGMPVMPGVLIVESIAQTARVIAGRGDLQLKRIENIKFRHTIEPGDTLEISVSLEDFAEDELKFFGEVYVKQEKSASGYIILSDEEK